MQFFIFKNEKLIFEMIDFIIIGMRKPPFRTNSYKMCENGNGKLNEIIFYKFLKPCPDL